MADLDDFFAKKDRKKSKSVKKFATADEMAKKLEDTKQKTDVRPKKDRPATEGEEAGSIREEEEWKEYEEPVKDYTGLKLQVLQRGTRAPESGRDTAAEDSTPENSKNKGPWNKPVEAEQVVVKPPPPPVEEKIRATSTYVPPQSRQRPCDGSVRRPQNKASLDIHNEDYFPVLGAGAKRGGGWSTAGGAPPPRAQHALNPLALGNRFTSLPDDS
ncbi:protein CDV3 homolog [Pieris rapae]|uniref:protein CDV3 homolog n=1 Tax=Pieris rapae TaxID=64459 RepID=UPI000B9271BE|nr:protein CDV3 homolog [Pieris rapae]XP_045529324.1 protein CDV3 homolog [Pieris brassicae]